MQLLVTDHSTLTALAHNMGQTLKLKVQCKCEGVPTGSPACSIATGLPGTLWYIMSVNGDGSLIQTVLP